MATFYREPNFRGLRNALETLARFQLVVQPQVQILHNNIHLHIKDIQLTPVDLLWKKHSIRFTIWFCSEWQWPSGSE